MGPPARPQEIVTETRIEYSSHQNQDCACPQVLQLEPSDPSADRLKENCDRRHDDHCSLKSSGEEGDPLIPIEELRGRRFGAELKTKSGKPHGDYVDDRFGRVGKNGSRMRHEKGCSFAEQHGQAKDQGETHGEARISKLRFVSPVRGVDCGLAWHARYSLIRHNIRHMVPRLPNHKM